MEWFGLLGLLEQIQSTAYRAVTIVTVMGLKFTLQVRARTLVNLHCGLKP